MSAHISTISSAAVPQTYGHLFFGQSGPGRRLVRYGAGLRTVSRAVQTYVYVPYGLQADVEHRSRFNLGAIWLLHITVVKLMLVH